MTSPDTPTVLDIREPQAIEDASLAIIDAEVGEPKPFEGIEWEVARRMVHTTADFELLALARFHPLSIEAGLAALGMGRLIITDTHMARVGIPVRRLGPLGCRAVCYMDDERVAARARADGTTRARAAVDLAYELGELDGCLFVVGNAPTALLRLLELAQSGALGLPALVVGMPVGFVNAAESKELFMAHASIPFICVAGRKGGSALAASVVNALAIAALRGRTM